MADRVLTRVQGGATDTIHINTDKFAGVRTMGKSDGSTITVDRTAQVIDSDRKGESRPLLSKVVGGASAAYSLRDLNDKAGNNKVVRVRRSSDNAEKDFTASEMGAALEDWVNEDVSFSAGNTFFGNTGATVINATPTAFDATATGGTFDVRTGNQNYIDAGASEVTVNFTVSNFSSSQSVNFEVWNPDSSGTYVLAGAITGNGAYTLTFNVTESGSGQIFRFRGTGLTSGDTISVSSLSLSWTKASGFVETWYDQSGNDNHATQGTAAKQPKIVDAGSLVTGGLDFDGVNDTLVVTGNPVITANSAGTYSAFSVQKVLTSNRGYLYGNASATDGSSLYANHTGIFGLSNKNAASNYDIIARDGNKSLLSAVYNNGDAGMLVNGGGTMTDVGIYDFNAGSEDFIIGNRNGGTSDGTRLDGTIQEIIVYNSDQSANRAAIEANINNQYDIY